MNQMIRNLNVNVQLNFDIRNYRFEIYPVQLIESKYIDVRNYVFWEKIAQCIFHSCHENEREDYETFDINVKVFS